MFKYIIVFSTFAAVIILTSSDSVARCFSFTWLGPSYNNASFKNETAMHSATCADIKDLVPGAHCVQPLVISEDGTWPDVDYIWKNYRDHATCVLSADNVCAQYTYYFNGKPENSTFMCTRATNNEGAVIKEGCFEKANGNSSDKVCFCQSVPGDVPCNRD